MWWFALGAVVLATIPLSIVVSVLAHRRSLPRHAGQAERLVDDAIDERDPARRRELFNAAAASIERLVGQSTTSERHRDAAFVLGYVRFEQERYEDAVRWLEPGLRRPLNRDQRRRGLELLAESALRAGSHQIAEQAIERLLRTRAPDHHARHTRLTAGLLGAVIAAKRGDRARARSLLTEARTQARRPAERLDAREVDAVVHHYAGDHRAASTTIATVVDARRRQIDDDWQARTALARAHLIQAVVALDAGEADGARRAARAGAEVVPANRPALANRLAFVAARASSEPLDAIAATARDLGDGVLLAHVAAETARRHGRRGDGADALAAAVHALEATGELVEARWLRDAADRGFVGQAQAEAAAAD